MPMTATEKLIEISGLNVCATAAEHFCSSSQGNGTIVKRVYDEYKIKYKPEQPSKIKYVSPKNIKIKYVAVKNMNIEYVANEKSAIKYIQPNTIKIKQICKP